jgi:TolA-binding protein
LIRGGEALPSRVELPANVALRAGTRARVLVHGVSVVIAASSQIRWRAPERVLVLEAGTVQVDGGPVRIATDQFRVDASGAATITARTVSVQRGSARVTGADGSVSRVPAGASWRVSEPPPMKPSAGRLLAQARAAFAARDHAAAERHADAALDAGPSRAQAAEARTILAESAHAAGRLDEALRRYEAIASRFGDLPAGETALFAAARLEGSRDRTDAARALFERYLERYPSGRFAGEARRRTRAPADQE